MKIETRELERTFTLDRKSVSEETRTVSAALSSEAPVERIFGTEILAHTKEAINMERAKDGLPLLWAHDHKSPIGRVENIRLDADKVLRGDLRFSKNAKATEVWEDVKDGFLRDFSIGYRIDEYEENDDGTVPITRWSILESSVVTVPADSRVGINRNHEVIQMTEEVKTDGAAETETRQHEKPEVRSELKLFTLDKERERQAGAKLEAFAATASASCSASTSPVMATRSRIWSRLAKTLLRSTWSVRKRQFLMLSQMVLFLWT